MSTSTTHTDILYVAPVRRVGIAGNSLAFALRALAEAGLAVEVWDTSPTFAKGHVARDMPAWLLDLCNTQRIRIGGPESDTRPRAVIISQDARPHLAEKLASTGAPILIIEEPAPLALDPERERHGDACAETDSLALALARSGADRIHIVPASDDCRERHAEARPDRRTSVDARMTGRIGPSKQWYAGSVKEFSLGAPNVVGRHSFLQEPHWSKDPALHASYPARGGDLRVFVGRFTKLRRLAQDWSGQTIFLAPELKHRIADIDFWVLGRDHPPDRLNDLGVEEALAAGCVVVLPPEYRPWFGSAAAYAGSQGVYARISHIAGSRTAFRNYSRRALKLSSLTEGSKLVQLLYEEFGLETRRAASAKVRLQGSEPRNGRAKYRVAFVTSNGAGMGHLSRLLAVASRMNPEQVDCMFVSLSSAVPVVERYGFPYAYIASRGDMGMDPRTWNNYAENRFRQEFQRIEPDMIVFDGTWPYRGFMKAAQSSGAMLVWSLRGMWRADVEPGSLVLASQFDSVVLPSDVASSVDLGPTAGVAGFVSEPITLVGPEAMIARNEARSLLGISEEDVAVLLTLGAGALNDISDLTEALVERILELDPGCRVFVTRNPIATSSEVSEKVTVVERYPLADVLTAFDWVASAAGYNSVHEIVQAEIPALWLPNTSTQTDDQVSRAKFLHDLGAGICLIDPDLTSLREGVSRLMDQAQRREMAVEATGLVSGLGGAQVASHLEELLEGRLA